jgi:hypothetical protein
MEQTDAVKSLQQKRCLIYTRKNYWLERSVSEYKNMDKK